MNTPIDQPSLMMWCIFSSNTDCCALSNNKSALNNGPLAKSNNNRKAFISVTAQKKLIEPIKKLNSKNSWKNLFESPKKL
jgi:hypothetical protein